MSPVTAEQAGDNLRDALALVRAVNGGDEIAVAAVLAGADCALLARTLAVTVCQLVGVQAEANGVPAQLRGRAVDKILAGMQRQVLAGDAPGL